MDRGDEPATVPWWQRRSYMVMVAAMVAGGYYVWVEEPEWVAGFLPWGLVLACIGMHFFMHRGHGRGGDTADDAPRESAPEQRGPRADD